MFKLLFSAFLLRQGYSAWEEMAEIDPSRFTLFVTEQLLPRIGRLFTSYGRIDGT